MADPPKRSQTSGDEGHRKKHHPEDEWRHYDVSGQFNACMDASDVEENSGKQSNEENTNGKRNHIGSNEADEKICLDGDLRGDAHINSRGLIVGQAEVQSKNTAIDVNFEMQANRKHKSSQHESDGSGKNASGENDSSGSGKHIQRDSDSDSSLDRSEAKLGIPAKTQNEVESTELAKPLQGVTPAKSSEQSEESSDTPKTDDQSENTPDNTISTTGQTLGESGEISLKESNGAGSTGSEDTASVLSKDDTNSVDSKDDANSVYSKDDANSVYSKDDANSVYSKDDTNSVDSKDDTNSVDSKEEIRSSTSSTEPFALSSVQVNQAPFIQKLYAMLEDPKLQHVIRWSPACDRFFINPDEQFSQTLCLYFKHTNISSFVRQLSMYGFHKVSNSSHHRDKWYPWEFRHMDGLFIRTDLDSIRSIKRRSTRQMNSKRVKYLSVVSGNDFVKQEGTPSGYMPGPVMANAPVGPLMPHYAPDPVRPSIPFPAQYAAPMVQQAGFPEVAVNGHQLSSNGNGAVHMNGTMNGNPNGNPNGHLNGRLNANDASSEDSTVALLKIHQSLLSQLLTVQESVTRISHEVNEMGSAIGKLISKQQLHPPVVNDLKKNTLGAVEPPRSKNLPNEAPLQQPPPLNGNSRPQNDNQSSFGLQTLLN